MEFFFICPYCGEEISMFLDISEPEQKNIEDCEVCCNPVEINFISDGQTITAFEAEILE